MSDSYVLRIDGVALKKLESIKKYMGEKTKATALRRSIAIAFDCISEQQKIKKRHGISESENDFLTWSSK